MPAVITFENGRLILRVGENTRVAVAAAASATASAAYAESLTGPTYADTAAGLAATTDGESFAVNAGSNLVSIYLNDGGSAVFQRTVATTAALAASTGASLIGLPYGGTARDLSTYITPEMRNALSAVDPDEDDQPFVQEAIDIAVTYGVELKLLRDYNIRKPSSLNRGKRGYLTAEGSFAISGAPNLIWPTLNFLSETGGNVDADTNRSIGLYFVRPGGWTATPVLWSFKCHNVCLDGNVSWAGVDGAAFDLWHKPWNGNDQNVYFDLDIDRVKLIHWRGEMNYGLNGPENMATLELLPRVPVARIRNMWCEESALNLLNYGGHQILDLDGFYGTKGQLAECLHSHGARYDNFFAEDVDGGTIVGGPSPDFGLPNVFWGKNPRDGTDKKVVLNNFVVRKSSDAIRLGGNVEFDIRAIDAEIGVFPVQRLSHVRGRLDTAVDQRTDLSSAFSVFPGVGWDSEAGADSDYTAPKSAATASFSGSTMTMTAIVSETVTTVNGPIIVAQAGHNVAAGTSGGRTALNPFTRIVEQLTGTPGGPGTYTIEPPVPSPISSQTVTIGQLTEPAINIDVDVTVGRSPSAVLNGRFFQQAFAGAGPIKPDTVRLKARGEGVIRTSSWGFSDDVDEVGVVPLIDDEVVFKDDAFGTGYYGQILSVTGAGTYKVIRNRVLLTVSAGTHAISLAKELPDPTGGNGAHEHGYSRGWKITLFNTGSGTVTFSTDSNQTFNSTVTLASGKAVEMVFSKFHGWVIPGTYPV